MYINRPITGALVGRQPFGGHRLSGVGAKAGGEEYLKQFLVARVVSEQTLRRGFVPTCSPGADFTLTSSSSSVMSVMFPRSSFERGQFLPFDILDQSHAPANQAVITSVPTAVRSTEERRI